MELLALQIETNNMLQESMIRHFNLDLGMGFRMRHGYSGMLKFHKPNYCSDRQLSHCIPILSG